MCPDLFHLYSTLFCQFGATRPAYGSKKDHFGPFGAFLGFFKGPPTARLTWMCLDLFHPSFMLFHQFGDTRPAYGTEWRFWVI